MDDLSIAQGKINQLTRRIEELEELLRVARLHAIDQQVKYDLLEQASSNKNFCQKCEELLEEHYCFACYDEMMTEEEEAAGVMRYWRGQDLDTYPENDEMTQAEFQEWSHVNSPTSKIIQT